MSLYQPGRKRNDLGVLLNNLFLCQQHDLLSSVVANSKDQMDENSMKLGKASEFLGCLKVSPERNMASSSR